MNKTIGIASIVFVLLGGSFYQRARTGLADDVELRNLLTSTWPSSVKSIEELKSVPSTVKPQWRKLDYQDVKVMVAVETQPTFGASSIDVYGYAFHPKVGEWQRFLAANIRDAGKVDVVLDERHIIVTGAANNDLNGLRLVSFDLAAVSDRISFVH